MSEPKCLRPRCLVCGEPKTYVEGFEIAGELTILRSKFVSDSGCSPNIHDPSGYFCTTEGCGYD